MGVVHSRVEAAGAGKRIFSSLGWDCVPARTSTPPGELKIFLFQGDLKICATTVNRMDGKINVVAFVAQDQNAISAFPFDYKQTKVSHTRQQIYVNHAIRNSE
jgi:hypothetical protein